MASSTKNKKSGTINNPTGVYGSSKPKTTTTTTTVPVSAKIYTGYQSPKKSTSTTSKGSGSSTSPSPTSADTGKAMGTYRAPQPTKSTTINNPTAVYGSSKPKTATLPASAKIYTGYQSPSASKSTTEKWTPSIADKLKVKRELDRITAFANGVYIPPYKQQTSRSSSTINNPSAVYGMAKPKEEGSATSSSISTHYSKPIQPTSEDKSKAMGTYRAPAFTEQNSYVSPYQTREQEKNLLGGYKSPYRPQPAQKQDTWQGYSKSGVTNPMQAYAQRSYSNRVTNPNQAYAQLEHEQMVQKQNAEYINTLNEINPNLKIGQNGKEIIMNGKSYPIMQADKEDGFEKMMKELTKGMDVALFPGGKHITMNGKRYSTAELRGKLGFDTTSAPWETVDSYNKTDVNFNWANFLGGWELEGVEAYESPIYMGKGNIHTYSNTPKGASVIQTIVGTATAVLDSIETVDYMVELQKQNKGTTKEQNRTVIKVGSAEDRRIKDSRAGKTLSLREMAGGGLSGTVADMVARNVYREVTGKEPKWYKYYDVSYKFGDDYTKQKYMGNLVTDKQGKLQFQPYKYYVDVKVTEMVPFGKINTYDVSGYY